MADKEGRWITVNGTHIFLKEGQTPDEALKERQIAESRKQADEKNTGIPSTMPTKESLLAEAKKLKGKDLQDAINRLDSLGDYYREDKRQKRTYLEGVIENNYYNDPSKYGAVTDAVSGNEDIIYVVTGIYPRSTEFRKRFGSYDIDTLFLRRKR